MQDTLIKLKKEYALMPKEALAEIQDMRKSLYIGIPKNINPDERRISLTPNSVAALISQGHRVLIEQDAGADANFDNESYINAGAELCNDKGDVYKANIILKSAPLMGEEYALLHPNQVLIAPLHLPTLSKSGLKTLIEKKVTALAWEYIKNEYQYYPIMHSMSEIAGAYTIVLAAKYMSNEFGKGILMGGISGQPPSKILIIGAGTVGENAARAAMGLGAQVQVFDDNIYRLSRIQTRLGSRIYTSVLDPLNLKKNIERADVIIGAIAPQNGICSKVVSEDMIRCMKKGAIVIDVSIDHGGCIETSHPTTHEHPIFVKHGIIHYAVPNISSAVSRTASYAISNILTPLLKKTAKMGGIEQGIKLDKGLCHGAYLYKGHLTKDFIAEKFNLRHTDLDLVLAADF